MSRTNTPLLLGAGAMGLLILAAAASSPTVRRTARKLEEKVENLITDWIPTLLRKTSEHEGQFWSVQANLDGNGVSYGILQWTQKSGSLGRLLRAMAAADPLAFGRIFGAGWASLLDVTARASFEAVDGAVLWAEPWVSRFATAGRWPAFQQVQARVAAESEYMAGAVEIARTLGVSTERAMTLYYNREREGPAGAGLDSGHRGARLTRTSMQPICISKSRFWRVRSTAKNRAGTGLDAVRASRVAVVRGSQNHAQR